MVGLTDNQRPHRAHQILVGKRALVIDEDLPERQRLVEVLSGWGVQVASTASPLQGIALLSEALEAALPFHLSFFGPNGHPVLGEQFAALVRSEPRLHDMPLLYIDQDLNIARQAALRRAGFFEIVTRPLDKTLLFDTLHRACGAPVTEHGVVRLLDHHRALGTSTPALVILLAEADPDQRRIVGATLTRGGHQLFEVSSGEQAIEALSKHSFDLVIVSLDLPGFSALDSLKLFRFAVAREDWPTIIGLAREPTLNQVSDLAHLEVSAMISSPVQPRELLRAMADVIRGHGASGRILTADPVRSAAQAPELGCLDEGTLHEIEQLGAGPEFLRELVEEFLTEIGALLEGVIQARGTEQCYPRMREFGHVLQDNAGSLGALRLYQLGVIASRYPQSLFERDGEQLLHRIQSAVDRTRDAFRQYLRCRGLVRSPG